VNAFRASPIAVTRPKRDNELNGDIRLSPWDRLLYLVRNLLRNGVGARGVIVVRPFCRGHVGDADGTPSPTRFLGQVFIREELPNLVAAREIRVLDVGCGSGRMSRLLARAGFRGTYVGVDIDNRFSRDADGGTEFSRRFIHGDAHDLPEAETFDLVFSSSALEHIPDDRRLLEKLDRLVAPGGMQVHIVPSGWGLPLYLWHGFRQYPLSRIESMFSEGRTEIYGLGGLCCFLLHLGFISVGEIVLRLRLRTAFPRLYRVLLNKALILDSRFGGCPGMYVVCRKGVAAAEAADEATRAHADDTDGR